MKVPMYEMYQSQETHYKPISSALYIKQFKEIRKFLHVVDNSEKEKEENKGDKCFKVKPVRNNCIKIETEKNQSIDEQIIPTKTKKWRNKTV